MTTGGGRAGVPGRRLYSAGEIAAAVKRLAAAIAADWSGKPLVLLGVLKGALYFTVDLSRELAAIPDGPSEIIVEYVCVSSYEGGAESNGEPRILLDPAVPLEGRNILIVDDVADNGFTLDALGAFLKERGAAALGACVLFDKPARRQASVPLDYVGLTLPDAFAVGYGLDYQELYRTLPYLAELDAPGCPPIQGHRKTTVPTS
ncbi:MAG TPA: hypoxanthine phosphoribosyltransferase [Candidatus Tumulicola sp.]|nr:hypoxanthine phosphoribosyltransferase [Candidatus Tumulicola sp.]